MHFKHLLNIITKNFPDIKKVFATSNNKNLSQWQFKKTLFSNKQTTVYTSTQSAEKKWFIIQNQIFKSFKEFLFFRRERKSFEKHKLNNC